MKAFTIFLDVLVRLDQNAIIVRTLYRSARITNVCYNTGSEPCLISIFTYVVLGRQLPVNIDCQIFNALHQPDLLNFILRMYVRINQCYLIFHYAWTVAHLR